MRSAAVISSKDSTELLLNAYKSSAWNMHHMSDVLESSGSQGSNVGESVCGEPLTPQHLLLDFTPIEDIDNDIMQKKCCSFWEFLKSRNDLRNLMALPESNLYADSRTSKVTIETEADVTEDEQSGIITKIDTLGCNCTKDGNTSRRGSKGSNQDITPKANGWDHLPTKSMAPADHAPPPPPSRCGLKR